MQENNDQQPKNYDERIDLNKNAMLALCRQRKTLSTEGEGKMDIDSVSHKTNNILVLSNIQNYIHGLDLLGITYVSIAYKE
jgi:hypothetical protein